MQDVSPGLPNPTYDELLAENQRLRQEIGEVLAGKQYTWKLLVETGRRLQISSASIKAAVSSLLNYDILWDPSNQHEFLQTIDSSVEKVSKLVLLMTLAFRAEAGSLVIKREPQELQEILAIIQAEVANKFPNLIDKFSLPKGGKPVLVDYEYLIIALNYLFEFLQGTKKASKIQVRVEEGIGFWNVDITNLEQSILNFIDEMRYCKTGETSTPEYLLLPEYILSLHVACEILHAQGIEVEVTESHVAEPILRLRIPSVTDS